MSFLLRLIGWCAKAGAFVSVVVGLVLGIAGALDLVGVTENEFYKVVAFLEEAVRILARIERILTKGEQALDQALE